MGRPSETGERPSPDTRGPIGRMRRGSRYTRLCVSRGMVYRPHCVAYRKHLRWGVGGRRMTWRGGTFSCSFFDADTAADFNPIHLKISLL